jgi:hypothetical protein
MAEPDIIRKKSCYCIFADLRLPGPKKSSPVMSEVTFNMPDSVQNAETEKSEPLEGQTFSEKIGRFGKPMFFFTLTFLASGVLVLEAGKAS